MVRAEVVRWVDGYRIERRLVAVDEEEMWRLLMAEQDEVGRVTSITIGGEYDGGKDDG